jgi:hypothetical protein
LIYTLRLGLILAVGYMGIPSALNLYCTLLITTWTIVMNKRFLLKNRTISRLYSGDMGVSLTFLTHKSLFPIVSRNFYLPLKSLALVPIYLQEYVDDYYEETSAD